MDSNNERDAKDLIQATNFNISSNPRVRAALPHAREKRKQEHLDGANVHSKQVQGKQSKVFLHKIKKALIDDRREVLSQDQSDKLHSKIQPNQHSKQQQKKSKTTMHQSLSLHSLYQPLPSPLPHHSNHNNRQDTNTHQQHHHHHHLILAEHDNEEEKKISTQTHNQNSLINSSNQPTLGTRGNGIGKYGSRVPKQPHQHFIESSKAKRTLAPSSRKHPQQQQLQQQQQQQQNQLQQLIDDDDNDGQATKQYNF